MNRYSEAFEGQILARENLMAAYVDPRLRPPGITRPEREQWLTDVAALQRATPFYWNTRTTELVMQASKDFNLADITISRQLVFCDVAWHYFAEKPPFEMEMRTRMPDGSEGLRMAPVRAITWYYFGLGAKPYLGCTAWAQGAVLASDGSPAGPLTPVIWGCVYDGAPANIQIGPDVVNFIGRKDPRTEWEIDQMMRFVVCASTFLRQEIFTAPRTPLERQTRKRLERRGNKPLDISVVQLRRAAAGSGKGAVAGEPREYDFCWSVRGHVRQQPYPSLGVKLPLYIHGYLKGDLDKPLKPRTTPIYSVTR